MSTEEDFRMNKLIILERRKRGGATRKKVDRIGQMVRIPVSPQQLFKSLKRLIKWTPPAPVVVNEVYLFTFGMTAHHNDNIIVIKILHIAFNNLNDDSFVYTIMSFLLPLKDEVWSNEIKAKSSVSRVPPPKKIKRMH